MEELERDKDLLSNYIEQILILFRVRGKAQFTQYSKRSAIKKRSEEKTLQKKFLFVFRYLRLEILVFGVIIFNLHNTKTQIQKVILYSNTDF